MYRQQFHCQTVYSLSHMISHDDGSHLPLDPFSLHLHTTYISKLPSVDYEVCVN